MRTSLLIGFMLLAFAGCQCGEAPLVSTYDGPKDEKPDTTPPPVTPKPGPWCASDCDCGAGTRCVVTTGELATNECLPGENMCSRECPSPCGQGQKCVGGVCVVQPCVGTNCISTFDTSVQGRFLTFYELDIHEFAEKSTDVSKLLDVLRAITSGQDPQTSNCASLSTTQGKLICLAATLYGSKLQGPPWVSQLIGVLADTFRFGAKPIRARGQMQLAEQDTKLIASETWSEMWLEYNGQELNVMNNQNLGQNGTLTVTVGAFGGYRSPSEVYFGPRDIEFDVNKLLVNTLNVAISAASGGKANDVSGLLSGLLCDRFSHNSPSYLLCNEATQSMADGLAWKSGLGGLKFSEQRATIYDLDGNRIADALGMPATRGSVTGEMSNGLIKQNLGPSPASSWYGTK